MNAPETIPNGDEIDVSGLKKINRDRLMSMASEVIDLLHHRTTTKRFKESQHDRARLQYARACVAAISAYTTLLKDSDLDQLTARIEQLEKQQGLP